jgi:hypothetical protein
MTTLQDCRAAVVASAHYYLIDHAQCHYTEGPNRNIGLRNAPFALPVDFDCTMFYTTCFKDGGVLNDPNGKLGGVNYSGEGYSGTLSANGKRLLLGARSARPGDGVMYGPGTGEHWAMIVVAGADPLTISMGAEGDPHYIHVSQDNRWPKRFYTFDMMGTPRYPPGMAPTPPVVTRPNLAEGMQGQYVTFAQNRLNAKGAKPKLAVDGQFGPLTKAAVMQFQTLNKMPVLGVINQATWAKLA